MLQYIMDIYNKIIQALKGSKVVVYTTGPNTLDELLVQFDQPAKEKTQEDIIRDYTIKETMASLELSYLKEDPSIFFTGNQKWFDHEGNKCFDFVPCALRPEVLYCSYGKN